MRRFARDDTRDEGRRERRWRECDGLRGFDGHSTMVGRIPVDDSSRADVQHHEDVDKPERRRDRQEEVAGQDRVGVIAHKGAPPLGSLAIARRTTGGHVASHGPRRHAHERSDHSAGSELRHGSPIVRETSSDGIGLANTQAADRFALHAIARRPRLGDRTGGHRVAFVLSAK